jgi:glycosyltransferase involved in cell wall biosynthesis
MKISVFMDDYKPMHETKDPGQIPMGLKDIGYQTELITLNKKELENYKPTFPINQTSWETLSTDEFWAKNNSDAVVSYTWLGRQYMPMLQKIKASGKKNIIKIDTDGHVGYPLHPVHLRIPLSEDMSLRSLRGHIWWQIPIRMLHRRALSAAQGRIRQMDLSDAAIVESPMALANLNYFLSWWGRQDIVKKTYFVPDPVTPEFMDAPIHKKQNIIVSYGRWNDIRQKNTINMVQTIVDFLNIRPEYTAILFGGGKEILENLIKDVPKNVADKIKLLGFVEREDIKQILSTAKIYLAPSRWESFGIAAGESLCMGCSVVATPVESLYYLAMQGFSGSVSPNFTRNGFFSALVEDAIKWDRGYYSPEKIAAYWRPLLDRKTVARSIAEIAEKS